MVLASALAASAVLATIPSVSAPIRFPSASLEAIAAIAPVSAGWDGTAFQLAYMDGQYARLNRLSPSGVLLDDTGEVLAAIPGQPIALTCDGADCLFAEAYIYGRVISHSATTSGLLTLTNFTLSPPLALDWDGAHYLMLWVDMGNQLRASRFSAVGAPLDGPGGLALGPASFSTSSGAQVTCTSAQCLALWMTREGAPLNQNVYAARLSTDGGVLDVTPFAVANTPDDELNPSVSNDGTRYLAAWLRAPADGGAAVLEAASIDATGALTPRVLPVGPPGAVLEQGPCVGFDGAQFRLAWLPRTSDQLLGLRVSPSGTVLDAAPVALVGSQGGVAGATRCASGGGAVLVTYNDRLTLGAGSNFGVLLGADGGVTGPTALSIALPAQSKPSLASDGQGFKLVWTEKSATAWRVRGVDFGPGGFSAVSDALPFATSPSGAMVSCDGQCLLGWVDGVFAPTMSVALLPATGAPVATSAAPIPAGGAVPLQLAAIHGTLAWELFYVASNFQVFGEPLSTFGQPVGLPVLVDDLMTDFPGVTSLGGVALARGGNRVWLGTLAGGTASSFGQIASIPDNLLGAANVATRNIGAVDPQSLSFGSGLVVASADVTDAGAGEYITLFDDAGVVSQRWPIGIGGTAAIAFDGQQHLAVGTYHDAGSAWVLAQVLAANGQPMGTPFTVYQTGVYSPGELVAAAMTPGTFAVAYTQFDPTRGASAQRLSVQLVSLNGLPVGTACTVASDCASFVCQGVCVAAPDGGLMPPDAGPVPDAGVADAGEDAGLDAGSTPDAGAAPDSGSPLDAGETPDGGEPEDAGTLPTHDGLGVACGCSASGALPLLGLLTVLSRRRRRRF